MMITLNQNADAFDSQVWSRSRWLHCRRGSPLMHKAGGRFHVDFLIDNDAYMLMDLWTSLLEFISFIHSRFWVPQSVLLDTEDLENATNYVLSHKVSNIPFGDSDESVRFSWKLDAWQRSLISQTFSSFPSITYATVSSLIFQPTLASLTAGLRAFRVSWRSQTRLTSTGMLQGNKERYLCRAKMLN